MNITKEKVERLQKLQEQIHEDLDEFKQICLDSMNCNKYNQFKYRTLGHIEPAVSEDTEWFTKYSSIDSLEKVVGELQGKVLMDEQ